MPIVSQYEIHRGRNSELQKMPTGRATITMIDTNGSLDPASGSGSYDPMTPVAIGLTNPVTSSSSPIFVGNVSKWDYKMYPTERYGIATVECVDALDIFASTEMSPTPLGSSPAFGDVIVSTLNEGNIIFYEDDQVNYRINEILDQLGWPAGNREIFTGNVRLKETVYAPRQPALTAMQDACDAEFPGIAIGPYMSKSGVVTFHGRLARFNPTDAQYHITTWKVGDVAAVNADSSYALIFDLDYDIDKDRIVNDALATPEGIADADIPGQRATDAASIAQYGTRSWSAENLITDHGWLTGNDDLGETLSFAQYMVDNYKQPATRINRIRFQRVDPSSAYGAAEWALLCGIDISDRLQVKTTHHGGAGGFNNAFYFVEGLHYSVRPLNAQMLDVTLDIDVTPATYYTTAPN